MILEDLGYYIAANGKKLIRFEKDTDGRRDEIIITIDKENKTVRKTHWTSHTRRALDFTIDEMKGVLEYIETVLTKTF